ncbi:MAG: response regulator [Acidimicrobiales bacterium]
MGRTVVIAEDEAIVRLDLREILEEQGFEVVGETGRGDEAVALAKQHEPDLVILDIKMPGLDGLSAAKDINVDRKSAILILTAFSQRNLIEEARDAGALAYLVKPFQQEELLPAIEVALARFAEMQALEAEVAALSDDKRSLEEQLETRRWVDRAKGKLMDDRSMSESESFSFIQQTAMNRRTTMREVAKAITEGSIEP